jgi:hypothetical protein
MCNVCKRLNRTLIICALIVLSALPASLVSAQEEESRYFEESGHNVSGEFLRFYDQYGGRVIFGYPLTRQFEENGRQVQYFQRVRMELHGETPREQRIELGLLGDELGYRQSPILPSEIPPADHSDKRYFAETGHTVSFAFLEFWESNGGVDILGYPISEWVIEPNGRIVQYFQRNKMEWYPENPAGQRVQLGMLGTIYVEQYVDPVYREREDPYIRTATVLEPTPRPQPLSSAVIELQTSITLKHPITRLGTVQTTYIYVLDQDNHGVEGASVEIDVVYKDGQVDHLALEETNANGYGQIDFDIGSPAPGYVVVVNLIARYGELESRTSSAFLPWW